MKINFKAVLSEYWYSNFGLFFLVDETIYMYRCKFNLNFLEKLNVLITLKYKFGYIPHQITKIQDLNSFLMLKENRFFEDIKEIKVNEVENVFEYNIVDSVCYFKNYVNNKVGNFCTSTFAINSSNAHYNCVPYIVDLEDDRKIHMNFKTLCKHKVGSFKFAKGY